MSPAPARAASAADTLVDTLGNGVRVLVVRQPQLATAAISVFVRTGSDHESARENGVSHVVEHMAFKGTRTRSCQQVNLDAERLGADVDAHTDRDHTAYHMRGLARDAAALVAMLGDIVTACDFPADEFEREREVLLQEFAEDGDDPVSTAFKCFDRACYGEQAAGRPVIGTRTNLRRFTREDLVGYAARQYTGVNTVVAVAGPVDPAAILRAAEAGFGAMPRGTDNRAPAPDWVGGLSARRLGGCSQSHVVVGYPTPPLACAPEPFDVAAAVLGRGMSSPLLDELRERRGIVYHADCSADVRALCGQMVIEASTAPEHLPVYATEVSRLLREHAAAVDPAAVARARNQIAVTIASRHEAPPERLERTALDLFALGRVVTLEERMEAIAAVGADAVRDAFATMLGCGPAVALAGAYGRGEEKRVADLIGRG